MRQLYSTPKHQGRQDGWQRTFYRRRRGILEHLQSGRITLFDAAVHDFILLNAQSRVNTGSNVPPGIWHGSARKIWLLTGRQERERQIQRSLAKLQKLGWLKRFRIQGERGDYPILVDKFVIRDGTGKDFTVNARETTVWEQPVLEPFEHLVADVSVKRRRNAADASPLLQEADTLRTKDNSSVPAQVAPSQEGSALAALLKRRILENDPKARIASSSELKWARDADLLMRVDGRSRDEIQRVILWCQADCFWCSNVLSMGTLRRKFSQLFLKMAAGIEAGPEGKNRGEGRLGGAVVAPEGKYDSCQPELVI